MASCSSRKGRRPGTWLALLVLLASWSIAAGSAHAQAPTSADPSARPALTSTPEKLRVGIAGSEPFVIRDGEQLTGLSIDVWRALARELRLSFVLLPADSVEAGIAGIQAGKLDVLVGPISITAQRARDVEFTHSYFLATLAIASSAESTSLWQRIGPFLSKAFLVGSGSLILVLALVGTLLWLSERKRNPEMFPRSPLEGVANGIWTALVTMTTVGYGDRVPITGAGRIVAGVWMLVAMLTVSSLTAGIASALTLAQLDAGAIETAEQLVGRRVAVVRGTVGERFTRAHQARVQPQPSLEAALRLLEQGQVDAVVHDRPILQYHITRGDQRLYLSPGVSEPQGYGFALAEENELARRVTVAMLQAAESGELQTLAQRWLGE